MSFHHIGGAARIRGETQIPARKVCVILREWSVLDEEDPQINMSQSDRGVVPFLPIIFAGRKSGKRSTVMTEAWTPDP